MTTYVRVKSKATGHEFDLVADNFDPEKYRRVDEKRYPATSRPRRFKPNISKGGGPARTKPDPVDPEKE